MDERLKDQGRLESLEPGANREIVIVNWFLSHEYVERKLGIRLAPAHKFPFGDLAYDYEEGLTFTTTLEQLPELVRFVREFHRKHDIPLYRPMPPGGPLVRAHCATTCQQSLLALLAGRVSPVLNGDPELHRKEFEAAGFIQGSSGISSSPHFKFVYSLSPEGGGRNRCGVTNMYDLSFLPLSAGDRSAQKSPVLDRPGIATPPVNWEQVLRFLQSYNCFECAWNACARADWMLWLIEHVKAMELMPCDFDRELRLFACWCARTLLSHVEVHDLAVQVVNVAERCANGDCTLDELSRAREAARQGATEAGVVDLPKHLPDAAGQLCCFCAGENRAIDAARFSAFYHALAGFDSIAEERAEKLKWSHGVASFVSANAELLEVVGQGARAEQAQALREILGNPFTGKIATKRWPRTETGVPLLPDIAMGFRPPKLYGIPLSERQIVEERNIQLDEAQVEKILALLSERFARLKDEVSAEHAMNTFRGEKEAILEAEDYHPAKDAASVRAYEIAGNLLFEERHLEPGTPQDGRSCAEELATDPQADVASYVLEFVLERMMIDKLWSIREPRAFTWWPYKLAQRVWAEPVRMDEGAAVCRIHAETALLKEVPPTKRTYASLAILNGGVTLNRYFYDAASMRITLRCCAYFHAENAGWQATYFTNAVAIQAAQAHAELPHCSELFGAPPDETRHPTGIRTNPDDMLNVLEVFKQKGQEPSAFIGEECARIERMSPSPFLMANSDNSGATVEFPFPGCIPATTMLQIRTDCEHPKLGRGAFLLLRIPDMPGVAQDFALADRLNTSEMQEWSRSRCFGAWCKDFENTDPLKGLAYVCFVPSLAKMNGLLENEVFQMAARTRWLHSYLNLPEQGPDDISWRLKALEMMEKVFKKK